MFGGVGDSYDIGEINRNFDLVDDNFKQMVYILRVGHKVVIL